MFVENDYDFPCRMLWRGLLVRTNGDVYFCCLNKYPIGNLREQTFDEIWNGPIATEARRVMIEGGFPDICKAPSCHHYRSWLKRTQEEQIDVDRSNDSTE